MAMLKVVGAGLALFVLLGCGAASSPNAGHVSPSPSPTPMESPVVPLKPLIALEGGRSITQADVRAVVDGVFVQGIFLPDPSLYAECQYYRGGEPSFKACPLTPRLEARLTANTGRFPPRYGAGAFCRCLAVSPDISVTTSIAKDSAVAHVKLFGKTETVDLLMVRSTGYLLVDDIQCNGKEAASSIYVDPIPPC